MKKVFAVLVALTLVLSCAVMAFAAEDDAATGTITITNAIVDSTYSVYKMLDFEPSAADPSKGIYKIAEGWDAFFTTGAGKDYFTITNKDEKTVVLTDGKTVDQALATAAVAYAKNTADVSAAASAPATSENVTFDGLDLGYYAVDTTVGTLCSLTNTNSIVTAVEKNKQPDITKEVQEDSKMSNPDGGWGTWNDADIDQVVNYRSYITVGYGAVNYVMHDTMDTALTFNPASVKVSVDGTEYEAAGNYEVKTSGTCGCTFEIVFTNTFIAGIEDKDKDVKILVEYAATLNENAVVEVAHLNTVYLKYGENNEWKTQEHTTKTYTWKFDVLKYMVEGTGDAAQEKPLAGATFQLLDKDGNVIKFSDVTGDDRVLTYEVDADGTVASFTTLDSGELYFLGLDEGTYQLKETDAPDGYNILTAPVEVVITNGIEEGASAPTFKVNNNADPTVKVLNQTGSLLPETGGIGTTIFYVVGGLLMVAALVVLVSKKRMASFA